MKRWFFPLVRVEQNDDHGCAIAATATVCGLTYERSRAEFFPRRQKFVDDSSLHVRSQHVLRVVRRLGFRAVMADRFKRYRKPTIVLFSWYPEEPRSGIHAVVWDPTTRRIIDPGPDVVYGWDADHYLDLWKRSNYKAIVVTGKR